MTPDTDNRTEIIAVSRSALPQTVLDLIESALFGPHPESQLIAVLHAVQEHAGWLPPEQMDAVAQLLGVPTSRVTGVATFYHFFRLTPRGRHVIHVCLGTACYVKGADRLVEKLRGELGITFGETTKDGLFSLEVSRCLGTCGLAPVLMIDDDIYGQVTPDKIPALLEQYIEKE
jgi:NADH-quinone oxidoreductase E subunit